MATASDAVADKGMSLALPCGGAARPCAAAVSRFACDYQRRLRMFAMIKKTQSGSTFVRSEDINAVRNSLRAAGYEMVSGKGWLRGIVPTGIFFDSGSGEWSARIH